MLSMALGTADARETSLKPSTVLAATDVIGTSRREFWRNEERLALDAEPESGRSHAQVPDYPKSLENEMTL
jgi:hypothetical protein